MRYSRSFPEIHSCKVKNQNVSASYARNVFLNNGFNAFAYPGTDTKFASDVQKAKLLPNLDCNVMLGKIKFEW